MELRGLKRKTYRDTLLNKDEERGLSQEFEINMPHDD